MKNWLKNIRIEYLLVICFFSFELKGYAQKDTQEAEIAEERFIKIGNHSIFVRIKGSEDPKFTVVFESGAGGGLQDWTKVISMLPPDIRSVSYDRAGSGKSDKGPIPQTMAQNVFELHELLSAAKISDPVILVGQSIGGLIARLYTKQYGKNVKGLILVDPTHESSVLGSMKYGGWVRLREKAVGKAVPKPQIKDSVSTGYDPKADYMAEEFHNLYLSSVKNPRQLGNRPLVVLGAGIRKQPPGTPDEQWKQLRSERDQQVLELTALSTNSKFILDPKSSHSIQNDHPEIVAASIQMVINSIVSKTKL